MPRPTEALARRKPSLRHRQSSTFHYQTFPVAPPRNAGRQPSQKDLNQGNATRSPATSDDNRSTSRMSNNNHHATPLPKRQLAILAVIALAEQTALNSISPYLPDMASSFPEVKSGEVGLYVGVIASSFAIAQFVTNFMWGWLSDRVGRKPIVLLGTILTAACFVAFGFCRTLWQAVLVQALMGMVNGNQGVISTCLGEITDRTNQSQAFTYLPVLYGLGGITGPLLGGLLVFPRNPFDHSKPNPYPYLLPNILSASILLIDFILTAIFLEESLEEARDLPPLGKRIESLFAWMWQFTGQASRPTYTRRAPSYKGSHRRPDPASTDDAAEERNDNATFNQHRHRNRNIDDDVETSVQSDKKDGWFSNIREVFTRDTICLLLSYLLFQFGNIGYNSLYPIFSEDPPPTGRNLSPEEIGTSLALAGVVTIVFQVGVFGKLRERIGNKVTYRVGLAGFVVAFFLMPFVGYKDGGDGSGEEQLSGKIWLWVELGAILIIKTVASVGGLTSALLLITNSAPSHAVLGTINGLAQTLSAAGRAVGPFISGALFTAATHVHPKGELLVFGVFGGIAALGVLLSFGIRSADLEAEGWDEDESDNENDHDEGSEHDRSEVGERSAGRGDREDSSLLARH